MSLQLIQKEKKERTGKLNLGYCGLDECRNKSKESD